ncbi:hypothetical protein [Streptomyces luteireticuli]|uniref:TetR family transcriptional regulator n=1 Tax=Streptomyces luteireticuli TaxID=173858 RepID=A0ABP3IDI0_9ACTN
MTTGAAERPHPRERLLDTAGRLFGDILCRPGFRGCGFLNAASEYPDPNHRVRVLVAEHRRWFHGVLRAVVRDAGHPDPEHVARALVVLRGRAMVGGHLDDPQVLRATLRGAAENLLAP